MAEDLTAMIARHEGFRHVVYCDRCGTALTRGPDDDEWLCDCSATPPGNLTIGFGTRVDGEGISRSSAIFMLVEKVGELRAELDAEGWFLELDLPRQYAILDLAYCVGAAGVLKFTKMIAALAERDWNEAAKQIWLSEFGATHALRCGELSNILLTGEMKADA